MAPTEPPVIPRQVLYRLNLRCPLTYRTGQSQAFPSRYLRDVNDGLGGVSIIDDNHIGEVRTGASFLHPPLFTSIFCIVRWVGGFAVYLQWVYATTV